MNEQLVNALIAALERTTTAQREQTEAINRLAESNVALSDVIIQSLAGDLDEAPEQQTYLSGNPGVICRPENCVTGSPCRNRSKNRTRQRSRN